VFSRCVLHVLIVNSVANYIKIAKLRESEENYKGENHRSRGLEVTEHALNAHEYLLLSYPKSLLNLKRKVAAENVSYGNSSGPFLLLCLYA
jgi:hypothetical protein